MRLRNKAILLAALLLTLQLPMALQVLVSVAEPEEDIPYGGKLVAGFTTDVRTKTIAHQDYQWIGLGCVVWPIIYDMGWTYYKVVEGEAVIGPVWPRMFTGWEVSEDGMVYTVHLAENIRFHDGEPLTAEDVKFTAETLAYMPAWYYASTGLERTEVVDDYTIRFVMNSSRPYPAMDWIPILPKHIWEPYRDNLTFCPNEEMIGAGPWKLKEWKQDEFWWFEVNEDYWAGRPYLDELVFKIYPSTEALYLALEAGEIDMIGYGGAAPTRARELDKNPNIDIIVTPGIDMDWLSVNVWEGKEDPIAMDVRVREAIAHALDRDTMINTIYLAYAEKIDSWIYPEMSSHNPNLPQYEYDVDLANQILDDAGYLDTDGDGVREYTEWGGGEFKVDLYTSTASTQVRIGELIKNDLEKIGMDVSLNSIEWGTLVDIIYNPDQSLYDLAYTGEQPGPVNEWIWEFALGYEPGSWNTAGYLNPEFDELYHAQSAEGDQAKRDQLWWQMEELMAEDLPYIYTIRPATLAAVRTDKFEGFVATMGGVATWVNHWSYLTVHLKEAPEEALDEVQEEVLEEAPTQFPWYLVGVAVVIIVVVAFIVMSRRAG